MEQYTPIAWIRFSSDGWEQRRNIQFWCVCDSACFVFMCTLHSSHSTKGTDYRLFCLCWLRNWLRCIGCEYQLSSITKYSHMSDDSFCAERRKKQQPTKEKKLNDSIVWRGVREEIEIEASTMPTISSIICQFIHVFFAIHITFAHITQFVWLELLQSLFVCLIPDFGWKHCFKFS